MSARQLAAHFWITVGVVGLGIGVLALALDYYWTMSGGFSASALSLFAIAHLPGKE